MGSVRFGDTKNGVHLSGPGWGALGVVFPTISTPFLECRTWRRRDVGSARSIGSVERRSGRMSCGEREVRAKPVITFIGGGYESRQAVRRKVHQYLGTVVGDIAGIVAGLEKPVRRPSKSKLHELLIDHLEGGEWLNAIRPFAFIDELLSPGFQVGRCVICSFQHSTRNSSCGQPEP